MIEKNVEVNVAEADRPIAKLVQIASQFTSKVCIIQNDKTVNAKSIMGVMALGLSAGQQLKIEIDGEDEADAMNSIEQFLLGK